MRLCVEAFFVLMVELYQRQNEYYIKSQIHGGKETNEDFLKTANSLKSTSVLK